jgi:hypothetical protein
MEMAETDVMFPQYLHHNDEPEEFTCPLNRRDHFSCLRDGTDSGILILILLFIIDITSYGNPSSFRSGFGTPAFALMGSLISFANKAGWGIDGLLVFGCWLVSFEYYAGWT